MFTLLFQCSCQLQQCIFLVSRFAYQIRYSRFTTCDGSRLIQSHDLYSSGFFQRNSGFKQDTIFCSHTVTNHDCYRCGKSQCTRAADNQYGNTSCECVAESLSGKQPYDCCNYRDQDNHRYKYTGNFICDLRNRRFCRSRIADHLDDLRQCGIFPHSRCLTADKSGLVDRSCRYQVTLFFIHRDTLSGQRRFIDCTVSFQNLSIHRNTFTRADNKDISFFHLLDRYGDFFFSFDQNGCLRCQIHKTFQRIRGLSFGSRLKHLSHGDQRQDHRCGFKIKIHHIIHNGFHIAVHLCSGHCEEHIHTP